jgi:hypothetical protein
MVSLTMKLATVINISPVFLSKFQHSIKDCNNQFEGIKWVSWEFDVLLKDYVICYFTL